MISSLSILIPTYNDEVVNLVFALSSQISKLGINAEILVGDDGSTDFGVIERNRIVTSIPYARLVEFDVNRGRASIRNSLCKLAKFDWILFIDGDMSVCRDNFIETYLSHSEADVIYGGYCLPADDKSLKNNLRHRYEFSCMSQHTVSKRRLHPFHDFHTSNFFVRRDIMLSVPFCKDFKNYGYEDVFWGKQLCECGYVITHIDNPVEFSTFESNEVFLKKTEEGLHTLYLHKDLLTNYSRIISVSTKLKQLHCDSLVSYILNSFRNYFVKNLQSENPSLSFFKLYRLGYYLSIAKC